jgi:hypothetical protein
VDTCCHGLGQGARPLCGRGKPSLSP